ncbi:hypothetical protein ACIP5U_24260 [Streptomyces sp. NPDC088788]|uniref:hypothetical protein n=1 Tax=Streptomyces sp. NPDC088788 TaxID=3365898 RepID=UPI0038135D3B
MADEHQSGPFRTALVSRGLLIPLGAEGVYGHGAAFEAVVNAVQDAITGIGSDQRATAIRLPPVYSAVDFAGTGYPQTFPHLGGVVSPFGRDVDACPAADRAINGPEAGRPVTPQSAGLALVPAACHPAYAIHRGAEIGEARVLDVLGQCFRREPSQDPFRMQAFRQREYVYFGDADGARAHRDRWVARSLEFLDRLGLDATPAAAADPFFGRGGRLLADNQLAAGVKTEAVVALRLPENGDEHATLALASCNYHGDHFGTAFGIKGPDGPIHTSCVGFGLERVALALLYCHGLEPVRWPGDVRKMLQL